MEGFEQVSIKFNSSSYGSLSEEMFVSQIAKSFSFGVGGQKVRWELMICVASVTFIQYTVLLTVHHRFLNLSNSLQSHNSC